LIRFHSLEDRIVKRFMHARSRAPAVDRRVPLRAHEIPEPPFKSSRKIKPSVAEVEANPRARSAIMRVMERVST
jgi:16S rRNA (cytosine1402-N4)-methyltransferase